jgi:hypothetical protein
MQDLPHGNLKWQSRTIPKCANLRNFPQFLQAQISAISRNFKPANFRNFTQFLKAQICAIVQFLQA